MNSKTHMSPGKAKWQFHTLRSFLVSHTEDTSRLHHPAFALSPEKQYLSLQVDHRIHARET
jgi:hypothetical protein